MQSTVHKILRSLLTHPYSYSRKARRTLSVVDLRRAARKPWRNLNLKSIPSVLRVVTTTAASSTPSANVPPAIAATISPSALLPGLPPGLSISSASGPLVGDKLLAVAGGDLTATVSDPVASGGGGGANAAIPVNKGDLQVVILD